MSKERRSTFQDQDENQELPDELEESLLSLLSELELSLSLELSELLSEDEDEDLLGSGWALRPRPIVLVLVLRAVNEFSDSLPESESLRT